MNGRGLRIGLAVAAGLAITLVAMWLHAAAHAAAGGTPAGFESTLTAAAWGGLLYFVMIAGVLANHLYTAASERASAGQPFAAGELIGTLRTAPRLWMALAVSPFLFHAVHLMASDVPDGATSVFFAFQNGFFWQAVFAGFQQKQQQAAAAPATA